MYRSRVCIHLRYLLSLLLLLPECCLSMDLNEPPYPAIHLDRLKRNYSNLMHLTINSWSVYTLQLNDESWSHYDEEYELDVVDKSMSYRGTTAERFRNFNVVGKSLEQVVIEAADVNGNSMEATVWIRNVVESIGISGMYRFCEITTAMSKPDKRQKIHMAFAISKEFLESLKRKFTELRLRTEPVDDLLSYVNELNAQPVVTNDMKRTYRQSCMMFMERYQYCTGLVTLHDMQSLEGMTGSELRNELMFTIFMTNRRLRNMEHQRALELSSNNLRNMRPFTCTNDTHF